MEVLNVKVEREMIEKLESLVRRKAYKNKSEAVRSMLEEHFQEHPELFLSDDFDELVKEADKISDAQFREMTAKLFKGHKTAAQMVAEGRER
jgi:Arc/MetJ-type ribon-helix-helix transcriptional regulator